MVEYKCKRCYKLFKQKIDYNRHLGRKIQCKNVNLEECEICTMKFINSKELLEHKKGCGKLEDKVEKLYGIMTEIKENCEKFKKKSKEKSKKIKKLEKEIEKIKNDKNNNGSTKISNKSEDDMSNSVESGAIGNIKGNKNKQKVNNYITIVNFGEESLKHLSEDKKIKYLSQGIKGIPKIFQAVHYNKKAPQNRNIKTDKEGNIIIKREEGWQEHEDGELTSNIDNHVLDIHDEVGEKLDKKGKKKHGKYEKKIKNKDKNSFVKKMEKKLKKVVVKEDE